MNEADLKSSVELPYTVSDHQVERRYCCKTGKYHGERRTFIFDRENGDAWINADPRAVMDLQPGTRGDA